MIIFLTFSLSCCPTFLLTSHSHISFCIPSFLIVDFGRFVTSSSSLLSCLSPAPCLFVYHLFFTLSVLLSYSPSLFLGWILLILLSFHSLCPVLSCVFPCLPTPGAARRSAGASPMAGGGPGLAVVADIAREGAAEAGGGDAANHPKRMGRGRCRALSRSRSGALRSHAVPSPCRRVAATRVGGCSCVGAAGLVAVALLQLDGSLPRLADETFKFILYATPAAILGGIAMILGLLPGLWSLLSVSSPSLVVLLSRCCCP